VILKLLLLCICYFLSAAMADAERVFGQVAVDDASAGTEADIVTAAEFQRSLKAWEDVARKALKAEERQYEPTPYVALSLKKARVRIAGKLPGLDPDIWLLGGINRVRGFVYDRENGDLILVGAIEPDRAPLTLDDLVVALRARFVLGEWPQVSIDPDVVNPMGQPQHVRFEGGIRDTGFGLALLVADYELKGLGIGYVDPGVKGFRTHWDRAAWREYRDEGGKHWRIQTRFWFYPMGPHVVVRKGVGMVQPTNVGVFTEVLSAEIDGKRIENLETFVDPASEGFKEDINDRFAELCRLHDSFNRLRGLQELVALSKALENMEEKPDLSWWLQEYPVTAVQTPASLPLVRRHYESENGSQEFAGGVQLVALALRLNAGDATALRDAVLRSRPSADCAVWAFKVAEWIMTVDRGQLRPEALPSLFSHAVFLQEHRRYREAASLYQRIVKSCPECYEAWINKGVILAQLDQPKEALGCLDEALRFKPDDVGAWIRKGMLLLAMEEAQKASECVRYAIRLNPDCAEAWASHGLVLGKLGRFDEGLKCLERALDIEPAYPTAWYYKALSLGDAGRWVDQLDCLEQAIKFKPDYAEAWSHKGAVLCMLGRWDEGLDCFRVATTVNPDCFEAWYNKGSAMRKRERLVEAFQDYDRATQLKPNHPDAWLQKGVTLGELGRFQDALGCFDRAIQLAPKHASAWYSKGVVLHNIGRVEAARSALQQAEKLGSPDARRVLKVIEEGAR